MELIGNGLNKGSHMYFHTPSQQAKKLLFYPISTGEFYCNADYTVERIAYNSILAIYVCEGSITLFQNGVEATAREKELLFIDCYKPHKYFTDTGAHTLWVHFKGSNSRQWYNDVAAQKGQKMKCNPHAVDCISNLIEYIMSNQNEYDISNEIYSLLCTISKHGDLNYENEKIKYVKLAKAYIESNYRNSISVDDIAAKVHMSTSYFYKIFKQSTGFTPYDYLLSVRLDRAKELLQQTDNSVQVIAYKTGFNSTSNFVYFFKKSTGMSPAKFRKIKF